MAGGIIIAAPASGSGKTTVTLALLRAFARLGVSVASAKIGPDYIDPAFHTSASRSHCITLDSWAMSEQLFAHQVQRAEQDADLVIAEGVMGLFDGTQDGRGSTAHVAQLTGWPIVLVVDASGMAASVGALVKGFAEYDSQANIAAVIFNRVGSSRHAELLTQVVAAQSIPVLGYVTRDQSLTVPSRHLGLVQAQEHRDLQMFLDNAADKVSANLDLDAVKALASAAKLPVADPPIPLPLLGQRIAIACDEAFAFRYEYVVNAWRHQGAEITFFSPLADQAPCASADSVYLPGGYPELHSEQLSNARHFMNGLRLAAKQGVNIFGECGGYMVLGEHLEDANGVSHAMAGLLPISTSFKTRRLALGYRQATLARDCVLGVAGQVFHGHEFHFSTSGPTPAGSSLFDVRDANDVSLGPMGFINQRVMGSYIHLIDRGLSSSR